MKTTIDEFVEEMFRRNRGIPLTLTQIANAFYGELEVKTLDDFYELMGRKLTIYHKIRKLAQRSGLHIFKIKKNGKEGYAILETREDFNQVIQRISMALKRGETLLKQLVHDRDDSPDYLTRVEKFYNPKKKKLSHEEFIALQRRVWEERIGRRKHV